MVLQVQVYYSKNLKPLVVRTIKHTKRLLCSSVLVKNKGALSLTTTVPWKIVLRGKSVPLEGYEGTLYVLSCHKRMQSRVL